MYGHLAHITQPNKSPSYLFTFLPFYSFTFLLCVFLSVYHAAASLMCGEH